MTDEFQAKTIFISIASVNDTEILPSIENAFSSALYPDRVFIGVGLLDKDSSNFKKIKSLNNNHIRVNFEKFNKNLLGVGKGRERAQVLYNEEDYFLQVDAHTHFNVGWDKDLIDLYHEAKDFSKSEKIIITCIPSKYKYFPERKQTVNEAFAIYPAFRRLKFWPGNIPRWENLDLREWGNLSDKFYPTAKASSAFMFGDKDFGKNTGIEKEAIFYDEEIFYSVNLFDMGYSFVFPNIDPLPISHLFASDINDFGGYREFWTKSLSKKEDESMTDKMRETFNNFLNDVSNREKIRKYEKYSKVSLRHGASIDTYIPKGFNL